MRVVISDYWDVRSAERRHEARDEAKVLRLARSMLKYGWSGPPLVMLEPYRLMLTGVHRIAALDEIAESDPDNDILHAIPLVVVHASDQDLDETSILEVRDSEDVADILDEWGEHATAEIVRDEGS